MHPFGELTARRQELGAALRGLRKSAGLSGEQIAEAAGISQSRVSRIELGQQAVAPEVVGRWADACGAAARRDDLVALAEAAATDAVSWRKAMTRGLAQLQQDSQDLEATATVVLNFQSIQIPGLLQVPEYARRVFAAGHPAGQVDIAAAVAARMNRQAILYDESKRIEFVLAEAALRWRMGPASLARAQIDRISTVSALGNITVGIIPQAAEANAWHDHGFNILDGRGDAGDAVVHVETLTSGLTITDPVDVGVYKETFTRLRTLAVTGDHVRALLQQMLSDLTSEPRA